MHILSPIKKIEHPLFKKHQVDVTIKCDHLIHPIISGNKWRKLKGNLAFAQQAGYQGVLSFGGAYSNHLHALAFACSQQKLQAKAIVRGEQHYENNATLSQARAWGLQCQFVDRQQYRLRDDKSYLATLSKQNPDHFIIPEGGSNQLALSGVGDVITELNQQTSFDTLLTPVGSGGTLAGLITADNHQHQLIGIAVLKQAQYLQQSVESLLPQQARNNTNWQILHDFHRGGYGKFSQNDLTRISDFNQASGLTFEPVYSGKMLLAFLDLLTSGYFPAKHKVVLLHTGGLQGINGLLERKKLPASSWLEQASQ